MQKLNHWLIILALSTQIYAASKISDEQKFQAATNFYTALFTEFSPGEVFIRLSPKDPEATPDSDTFDIEAWKVWSYQYIKELIKDPSKHRTIPDLAYTSLFKGFVAGGFRAEHMLAHLHLYLAKNHIYLLNKTNVQDNENDQFLKETTISKTMDLPKLHYILKRESDLSFLCGFIGKLLPSAVSEGFLKLKKPKLKEYVRAAENRIAKLNRRITLYIFNYIRYNPDSAIKDLKAMIKSRAFYPEGGRYDHSGVLIKRVLKTLGALD